MAGADEARIAPVPPGLFCLPFGEPEMRRGLTSATLGLLMAGVVARARAGDAPPVAPPAPAAPAAKADLPRQTIDLGNGVTFDMVLIPAGEFGMGSPKEEPGRLGDEAFHRVRITRSFWLGRTEVTQAVWSVVTGGNPSGFKDPSFPVTDVSWDDCQAFAKRLDEKVPGGGFRLPTEAEWEYACRAGSRTRFCCGEEEKALADYAWYEANSGKRLHPVGLLKPNGWGLHDMHGNVWEWCQDWHRQYEGTGQSVAVDPVASEPASEGRVQRGGCWLEPAARLRSASRSFNVPPFRYVVIGLRLARSEVADTPQAPDSAPPAQPPPPAPKPGGAAPPAAPPAKEGEVLSWAKVAPEQVEAARKACVPVAFENSIGMRFVLIPAGTFTMGSPETEEGHRGNEAQHEVTLTRPYYLAMTEVTNAQYRRFRATHRSPPFLRRDFDDPGQPVVDVSWEDAAAFAAWLSDEDGSRTYRLPTEAEWERACRAGTTTPFWWGSGITTGRANYDGREVYGHGPAGGSLGTTVAVGTLPSSPWGLYEIHGNVYEWCSDWRGEYPRGPVSDPTGPTSGESRVLRGGCWISAPVSLRSAYRDQFDPKDKDNFFGIRLAASVVPK